MSKRRKSLGKGLDALLGEDALDAIHEQPSAAQSTIKGDTVTHLAVADIRPGPWQPRRHFPPQALQELADSIASQGVLQPVLVCQWEDGYALIAGERRWRASQLAKIDTIPALIRSSSEVDNSLIALIENIQRADLGPLETAYAMERLQQQNFSHQQIASALGIARSSVSNALRLLNLSEQIQQMIEQRELEMGHARALLSLQPDQQLRIANQIIKQSLSVRQTEKLVQQATRSKTSRPVVTNDPDIISLSRRLGERLATAVTINHKAQGRGELQIAYASIDQLNEFIDRLAPGVLDNSEKKKND